MVKVGDKVVCGPCITQVVRTYIIMRTCLPNGDKKRVTITKIITFESDNLLKDQV